MNVVRFLAVAILFNTTSLAANIEWNSFTATQTYDVSSFDSVPKVNQ